MTKSGIPAYHAWLEAHRIADSLMAEAYESLSGEERGVLKKCIARLYAVWGERPVQGRAARSFRQGFGLEEDEAPARYALLVCKAKFCSPAALLATLMPALLAGVPEILPCFVRVKEEEAFAPDIPAALLGALELAGVERAFAASEAEVFALARLLPASEGRVLLLGEPGFGEPLILHAHRSGLPCRSLVRPFLYFSERLDAPVEQRFMEEGSATAGGHGCEDTGKGLPLRLDASHEDVWLWPELGPDWFRTRRMRIFSLP